MWLHKHTYVLSVAYMYEPPVDSRYYTRGMYVIVIPYSPGIYHPIPRAQPEGEMYFSSDKSMVTVVGI